MHGTWRRIVINVLLLNLVWNLKSCEAFANQRTSIKNSLPSSTIRISSSSISQNLRPYSFNKTRKLCLHQTRASAGDNDCRSSHSNNNKRRNNVGRLRNSRFALRTRSMIKKIFHWQRKNRKSVFAAAALTLSVLFSSQDLIANYVSSSPSISNQQNQHEIQVVHNQPERKALENMMSRGGSAAATVGNSRKAKTTGNAVGKIENKIVKASTSTVKTLREGLNDLYSYIQGPKADTLIILLATALITPLCQRLKTSPILGFLASGMLLGPNGFGIISGIHSTETLGELGIVFFLFEMGIELSVERLMSMRKDVFGLGFAQFITSALAFAGIGALCGLPANALVVLGGGLALSSSAFVLQLLKDKKQLATRFGKASFGILLFQDLAVVPLLVVTPILAGGAGGLSKAVGSAVVKASMALGSIAILGRFVLSPLFKTVAQAQSQESFLSVILLTVLGMSFMTEGLGLSNTLGAFLAGVLLSETKYRYQIEADIAPFRGILLGLFFVTVGFEIDVALIASNLPLVASIVSGIILIKAAIITALSLLFGLSLSTSQQTGLMLSQGGEFAFVAFGLARSLGILEPKFTKLMLTCVSLTMAVTPFLASGGVKIAKKLEEGSDFKHYLGQDREASEIKDSDDFVVVVGYGVVGKVVTDLLDRKFIRYVGLEIDPNKAIQARNAGLPVFYGDIGRQEVTEAFNVGKAKAVIVCISDKAMTTRAVIGLRRWYPDLKIFCRAVNAEHATRLQKTLDVVAMVPVLPEDNLLLTLPFGGAVLKSLGYPSEEVNVLLETKRKEVLLGRGLDLNEQQLELKQLGIETTEVKAKKEAKAKAAAEKSNEDGVITVDSDTGKDDIDEDLELEAAAAAKRWEETKKQSPSVAQVIEMVSPKSAEIVEQSQLHEASENENEDDPTEPKGGKADE